jgi:hypothetical protein
MSKTCSIKRCSWLVDEKTGQYPLSAMRYATTVTPILKRRLSKLGCTVLSVLDTVTNSHITYVVASRHGDIDRMMRLFKQLTEKSSFSPTDFSLSVHNAIIATHSIHHKNKEPNIALSGGKNSFLAGLLEAYALAICERKEVCYIYYDQVLPELYTEIAEKEYFSNEACLAMIIECPPRKHQDHQTTPSVHSLAVENHTEIEQLKITYHAKKASTGNQFASQLSLELCEQSILSQFVNFLACSEKSIELQYSESIFFIEKQHSVGDHDK